jgi:hypothetical protein
VGKYGTAGQATDDNIIRRMRIACWIPKARETHSEYAIRIAFSRQKKLLYERISMLQYLNAFSNNGIKGYINRKVNKMEENKG